MCPPQNVHPPCQSLRVVPPPASAVSLTETHRPSPRRATPGIAVSVSILFFARRNKRASRNAAAAENASAWFFGGFRNEGITGTGVVREGVFVYFPRAGRLGRQRRGVTPFRQISESIRLTHSSTPSAGGAFESRPRASRGARGDERFRRPCEPHGRATSARWRCD